MNSRGNGSPDPVADFIEAACVPRDSGHATGTLARAEAIRTAHPEIATADIHAAAVLGDEETVRRFLDRDPGAAIAAGGPFGWDALTHLCFSRYLRLDRGRSDGFVAAARALLDAGASPATGWWERNHFPGPQWECALYGAAGVAHHAGLTRLLLERGADPNDGEVTYHAPETHDNAALAALVESGRLSLDSLATMLLRKSDWHDGAGVEYLLGHGADPNHPTVWGRTALQNAVLRDNSLAIIERMMDRGADPLAEAPAVIPNARAGRSSVAIAARRGRGDVLALCRRRGFSVALEGVEGLIAACAEADADAARAIARREPALVSELHAEGGGLLARFAGVGNTGGVGLLLDLGVPVDAPFEEGDGYFGVAQHSTALHVAAWRARPEVVSLLIGRGAPIDAPDGDGRTPLALAVRACVDSYWMDRRSPASIEALLRAGATPSGARFPSGYAEADELLRRHRGA